MFWALRYIPKNQITSSCQLRQFVQLRFELLNNPEVKFGILKSLL